MDIDACINSYLELAGLVFQKKSTSIVGKLREVYFAKGRFDSRALEEAVKKIVISRGLSADATLSFGEEPKCKTYEMFFSPRCSVRGSIVTPAQLAGLFNESNIFS